MHSGNQWITRGFEAFSRGIFDSGGQNLYVSRAGILQRIHHMDLDQDGHADLLICNSQNHWERPPVYVYPDPLSQRAPLELPSDGSVSAAVADLNGDGYDDLVLAMAYNGSRMDLDAMIYYGSPQGLCESYRVQIPAPRATCVACGDFDGDGKPDIAFLCAGQMRVFYQTDLGFERDRFVDLEVKASQIAACDLDSDGFWDLYALSGDGRADVYWGGQGGIDPGRVTQAAQAHAPDATRASLQDELGAETEEVHATAPLAKIVPIDGVPHLFVPAKDSFALVPVEVGRSFGDAVVIQCPAALSVAIGDVDGDGLADLAIASRGLHQGQQCSWVYWGGPEGFSGAGRTCLPSHCACDVALGDLEGDGRREILLCQDRTAESFSFHSLLYRGVTPRGAPEPIRLESHDARRAFIANTSDADRPQAIVVNHRARRVGGDVDPIIYFGGPQGFSAEAKTHLKGRDAVDAVCCDLDDDGYPDIVTANCSENAIELDPGSFIFMGSADGYAYEPSAVLATTRAHGVCCADLNRDGYLDLVLAGFSFPEVLIFYGGPQGYDTEHPVRIRLEIDGETYEQARWIYLADLNGDGWLDLFIPQITSPRSILLWGGPEGFDISRRQMLAVHHASCAQAADLTGNGRLDLIVGGHAPSLTGPHDSFVYIYYNGPDGLREDRRAQLPGNGINAMAVADFNGDGLLDIFLANYHDGRVRDIDSWFYWGMEGGRFSTENRGRIFAHSASGAVAADFNEDGYVDLAVAYHKVNNDHLGHSAVWYNGREGFNAQRVTTLPSQGPHGMTRVGTGNQRDRGPEEYYVSESYQLPGKTRIKSIAWEAQTPAKTWVKAQLRWAESAGALNEAQWMGPEGGSSWLDCGQDASGLQQAGPWVQYRLALGAINGGCTPRVSQVRVVYE